MALLPVSEALARLLDGASPKAAETLPLAQAAGRVLAEPLLARRTQPPFDASAMDGYAVRFSDITAPPARLRVIGTAAAGKRFGGDVGAGESVRIFTGAPMPSGADTVVIQENTRPLPGGAIEIVEAAELGKNIRPSGLDFREGSVLLSEGRVLDPGALSLAASGNHPEVRVHARPLVALLATGDELVMPGETPGLDQIVASNGFGVAAIAQAAGAEVLDLGIAPDRSDAIEAKVREAVEAGADLLVTLGGASVGDHDLVRAALEQAGMDLSFWKIAMRPGKPLIFGRLGAMRCVGLPGNPVASLVCSHVFLRPLLARLAGRSFEADVRDAVLGADMPANDRRQDYVRASVRREGSALVATPFPVQDSSMLKFFADADALIIRPVEAAAARAGVSCQMLMLR